MERRYHSPGRCVRHGALFCFVQCSSWPDELSTTTSKSPGAPRVLWMKPGMPCGLVGPKSVASYQFPDAWSQ